MQFNQYSVRRFQLTKPIDRSHFQLYLLCQESSQHQGIGHLENENKDTSLTMNKGGTLCLSQETSQVASICTQAPSQKDGEVAWVWGYIWSFQAARAEVAQHWS